MSNLDEKLQQQIAFHLTGRRGEAGLRPMERRFRPALLARYADLTSLRYDFPLVLNRDGPPERTVLSLSRLVDEAVAALGDSPDRDRIARHGYRLERVLRRELSVRDGGDFGRMWQSAATRLASDGDELITDSVNQLWATLSVSRAISSMSTRTCRHE
jgi:hypothetical protein